MSSEPKTRQVRFAVWGLGRHAFKNVLPALKACPAVELVGVLSRSGASMSEARNSFDCASWADEEAMLGDERVDAVYLSTPTGLHHGQGLKVLETGHHLVCEKSLSHRCDTSMALIAAARKRGLVLCESFMFLFRPELAALLRLTRSESFGRLVSLNCAFYLPTLENPGFRHDPGLGGGAFLDVGCYPIALADALSAVQPTVTHSSLRIEKGFSVDTGGSAVLHYDSGAEGFLGWGYGSAYQNCATILGTNQSAHLNRVFAKEGLPGSGILLSDKHGRTQEIRTDLADGFGEMLGRVCEAARNDSVREELAARAERQARLMERVRASAQNT